jgi:hypothetical protein
MAEPMLSVYNINVWYGAIHAIKDISFNVNETVQGHAGHVAQQVVADGQAGVVLGRVDHGGEDFAFVVVVDGTEIGVHGAQPWRQTGKRVL